MSDERTAVDAGGGLEVEKWILRMVLITALAALVAAVLGSLDDIQRYRRINNM